MKAPRSVVYHRYDGDGAYDTKDRDRCRRCHLAEKNRFSNHTMPPVPAGAAALDARRLGEREEYEI